MIFTFPTGFVTLSVLVTGTKEYPGEAVILKSDLFYEQVQSLYFNSLRASSMWFSPVFTLCSAIGLVQHGSVRVAYAAFAQWRQDIPEDALDEELGRLHCFVQKIAEGL